jgi:hypothetical protein
MAASAATVWGVYQDGALIVKPDSIIAVEYKREWKIADYPQEEGGFESYDKVTVPFDVRLTMTKGGSKEARQKFLESIDTVAASLDTYDIVTPDVTYLSCNASHINYKRIATSGVNLITVEMWLVEIRVTVTVEFSNTNKPSGANPISTGPVQTITPSAAETPSTAIL